MTKPALSRFQCLLILAAATFPLGCNSARLSPSETNAILTIFDQNFSYSKARTFVLSAEINELCLTESEMNQAALGGAGGEGGAGDVPFNNDRCTHHDTTIDEDILAGIQEEMVQLGYELAKPGEAPDVVVVASAVARDTWYYSSGYLICDELLGEKCWDPGAGYPFTLPYGSLLITWIDGKSLAKDRLESAWLATIPWVYGTSAPRGNVGEFLAALNQAFVQSPYLEVSP